MGGQNQTGNTRKQFAFCPRLPLQKSLCFLRSTTAAGFGGPGNALGLNNRSYAGRNIGRTHNELQIKELEVGQVRKASRKGPITSRHVTSPCTLQWPNGRPRHWDWQEKDGPAKMWKRFDDGMFCVDCGVCLPRGYPLRIRTKSTRFSRSNQPRIRYLFERLFILQSAVSMRWHKTGHTWQNAAIAVAGYLPVGWLLPP